MVGGWIEREIEIDIDREKSHNPVVKHTRDETERFDLFKTKILTIGAETTGQ